MKLDLQPDEAKCLLLVLQSELERSSGDALEMMKADDEMEAEDYRYQHDCREQFRLKAQVFNNLTALYDEHNTDLPSMLSDGSKLVRFWPTDLKEIADNQRRHKEES